jgi:hypothetical protein
MSRHKVQKVQEPRLLPVTKLNGQEFLVDVEKRQFRNVTNSDEVIGMHSPLGRKMLRDMQGSEWSCHALSTGTMSKAEV